MTTAVETLARPDEPTRARYPDAEGFVERDDVRIFWERYGDTGPPLLFMPSWIITHSRMWKPQIAWFARRHRVVVFDGRGNGRSDRPRGPDAYRVEEFTQDALAVMDAAGVDRAAVVGLSRGAQWALELAAEHPERVSALVFEGAALGLTPWPPIELVSRSFDEPRAWRRAAAMLRPRGSTRAALRTSPAFRLFVRRINPVTAGVKFSRAGMETDFRGFAEWFMGQMVVPPAHSTRQVEDTVDWALASSGDVVADAFIAPHPSPRRIKQLCAQVRCPALVIHDREDLVCPYDWGVALAQELGVELVTFEGSGHLPHARKPIRYNLVLRDFLEGVDLGD